jgi:hypothetical protein
MLVAMHTLLVTIKATSNIDRSNEFIWEIGLAMKTLTWYAPVEICIRGIYVGWQKWGC